MKDNTINRQLLLVKRLNIDIPIQPWALCKQFCDTHEWLEWSEHAFVYDTNKNTKHKLYYIFNKTNNVKCLRSIEYGRNSWRFFDFHHIARFCWGWWSCDVRCEMTSFMSRVSFRKARCIALLPSENRAEQWKSFASTSGGLEKRVASTVSLGSIKGRYDTAHES